MYTDTLCTKKPDSGCATLRNEMQCYASGSGAYLTRESVMGENRDPG